MISGHGAKLIICTVPGDFIGCFLPFSAVQAVIETESLPTGILRPRSLHRSVAALTVWWRRASSPGCLHGHCQVAEKLTDEKSSIRAHTRLVKDSPRLILPPASVLTRPLMGCSPIAAAIPVVPKKLLAVTAQSAIVSCKGPTVCCCTLRPPTERSTLRVRKCLEPTLSRRSTLSSAFRTSKSSGNFTGLSWRGMLWHFIVISGRFARRKSISMSIGTRCSLGASLGASLSVSTNFPSPVTSPTTYIGQRFLLHIFSRIGSPFFVTIITILSWDSLHQKTRTLMVLSPQGIFRSSYLAPWGWTISGSATHSPPAPRSVMLIMGDLSPSSAQARITDSLRFSISGFARWTESKSRSASWPPASLLEPEPPPRPIGYLSPPSCTIKYPFRSSFLWAWASLIRPQFPATIQVFLHP